MNRQWRSGWLGVLAWLGLVACGSAAAGGGGSAAVQDVAQDSAAVADTAAGDAPAVADVAAADVQPDVAVDTGQDVKKPVKTIGALVNPPLDPPTFSKVVDVTGAKVTPDALQGHWTVLWFSPAASTAG